MLNNLWPSGSSLYGYSLLLMSFISPTLFPLVRYLQPPVASPNWKVPSCGLITMTIRMNTDVGRIINARDRRIKHQLSQTDCGQRFVCVSERQRCASAAADYET